MNEFRYVLGVCKLVKTVQICGVPPSSGLVNLPELWTQFLSQHQFPPRQLGAQPRGLCFHVPSVWNKNLLLAE